MATYNGYKGRVKNKELTSFALTIQNDIWTATCTMKNTRALKKDDSVDVDLQIANHKYIGKGKIDYITNKFIIVSGKNIKHTKDKI